MRRMSDVKNSVRRRTCLELDISQPRKCVISEQNFGDRCCNKLETAGGVERYEGGWLGGLHGRKSSDGVKPPLCIPYELILVTVHLPFCIRILSAGPGLRLFFSALQCFQYCRHDIRRRRPTRLLPRRSRSLSPDYSPSSPRSSSLHFSSSPQSTQYP